MEESQKKLFNELAAKYEAKFHPLREFVGLEFPEITIELLQKAIDENKPMKPYPIIPEADY